MTADELADVLAVLRTAGVSRFEGCGIKVEFGRATGAAGEPPATEGEAPRMSAKERLDALNNPLMEPTGPQVPDEQE